MTRNKFYRLLALISILPISIIVVSAIDLAITADGKFYKFFKDMSSYILLLMAPFIANIFTMRQKFIEKLETEWRRVVETKSKILILLSKKDISENEYIETYYKLSQDIDYLRIIYKNVGEDKKYIGLYPYETLHDFRRELEKCNPKFDPSIGEETKGAVRNNINESFKAFRDVYLIELSPPEPDYPIIQFNMRRFRKDGMTLKNQERAYAVEERLVGRFGLKGDLSREK